MRRLCAHALSGARRRGMVMILEADDALAARDGLDLAAQVFAEGVLVVALRLGDEVLRAVFQRLERADGPAFGQGTHHDDRQGIGLHELLERFKAVQARHLHVKGDDIDVEARGLFQRVHAVARGVHHLDFRILLQHGDQSMAHKGGIIHN